MKARLDRSTLLLVGFSVCMSVTAQTLLRRGMGAIEGGGAVDLMIGAVQSIWVWAGLIFFGTGTVAWLVVLSRIDLAVAYPMASLNFVLVTLLSATFLSEQVPLLRWIGTAIILLGILVVARGEQAPTEAPAPVSQKVSP